MAQLHIPQLTDRKDGKNFINLKSIDFGYRALSVFSAICHCFEPKYNEKHVWAKPSRKVISNRTYAQRNFL